MDIEKYRTFVTAAECTSFARAAEKLFLTTPTVAKHIAALEQDMGIKLFVRFPQGIQLTEEGQKRLALARQIVSCYDSLNHMNGGRTLEIYSVPCLEKIGVPGYLSGFALARPEISVELTECHGTDIFDALVSGKCELAFLSSIFADRNILESISIFNDRLSIAVGENHPLAGRKWISLGELRNESFIMMLPESGMPQFYETCCISCGFRPYVKAVCSREDNILSYVASGMGVAFFTMGKMKRAELPGVRLIPLKEEFFCGCVLAKLKGVKLSPAASAFWKYISNTK